MKRWILVFMLLALPLPTLAAPRERADRVRVDKSERRLYLLDGGRVIAEFPIALGGNPQGHKQQEGDQRTPEGHYTLDFKKRDSAFFRAIHVSYPNADDRARARRRGVSPGGDIMIHGQGNALPADSTLAIPYDWTLGCIALSNADLQAVWDRIQVPVPIEILP